MRRRKQRPLNFGRIRTRENTTTRKADLRHELVTDTAYHWLEPIIKGAWTVKGQARLPF
jgi:hypothetical protein